MPKLAILIPIFNGLNYTRQSLNVLTTSIQQSPWKIGENIFVVVIDDGSTDGSAAWIQQNYPDVVICQGDGNLWWSGAINVGARHAFAALHCSHVLLWNNDITPDPDYFSKLLEILELGKDFLLFGSKVLIKGTNRMWFMGGIFKPRSGKKFMVGLQQPDNETYQQITPCDWLTGMGTVVHKSVVEKIGYWDQQNFPQYHGDSDFTYRAKLAGFEPLVFPQLRIWNDTSNTGLAHKFTWKSLFDSMRSIKSDFNFSKDMLFYRKYSTGIFAYFSLYYKYFRFIGGFIKNKYFSWI